MSNLTEDGNSRLVDIEHIDNDKAALAKADLEGMDLDDYGEEKY